LGMVGKHSRTIVEDRPFAKTGSPALSAERSMQREGDDGERGDARRPKTDEPGQPDAQRGRTVARRQ
jgi:hypothetical protein